MGANSSSAGKSDISAYNSFTSAEKKCLQHLLNMLCGEGNCTTAEQQRAVLEQVSMLQGKSGVAKKQPKAVTERDFVVTMAHALKGNAEESALLILFLASGSADSAQYRQIFELFRELLLVALSSPTSKDSRSWHPASTSNTDAFIKCLLHDLVCKDGKLQCDLKGGPVSSAHDTDDVERWLTVSVSALYIVHRAFSLCFLADCASDIHPLVPICTGHLKRSAAHASEILDVASVSFLDRNLPYELRGSWRQLFSSSVQGESFQALVRGAVNQGPTVLVLRDQNGYVFGGFAHVSWNLNSQFFGSSYCFLFSLSPIMEVYLPSGLNENYMYLNLNQQTLPNGLAMGGQFGYFGLWLDPEYGKGSSQAKPKCSTYGSPQLSREPEFRIHILEVWSVGPQKDSPTGVADSGNKTILDADVGAKAMLNMIDKGNLSEDIRKEKGKH